jgi:Mn-dependent DtxR family transcriptional regulator
MGQSEVLIVLKKYKRPLGLSDIAKELHVNTICVSHSIARLIKGKEVKTIEIDRFEAKERYGCCKRMRLYYT